MPARTDLPAVGAVLAIPLAKGFWGAGWVGRRGKLTPSTAYIGPHVVVAIADWFGRAPPTMASLRAPKVLHIDHDGYDVRAVFQVNDPLPNTIAPVGQMKTVATVGQAPWFSGWQNITRLMELQRAWNVDRAASAAAYAKQQEVWARKNARQDRAADTRTVAKKKTLTIAKLRRVTLLAAWVGAMPARRVEEGRARLQLLLDALEAAKKNRTNQVEMVVSAKSFAEPGSPTRRAIHTLAIPPRFMRRMIS